MRHGMLAAAIGVALVGGCSKSGTPVAADNTARNTQDRPVYALTAEDQSNNQADRGLTQRIRQAVSKDDSLSVTARNVKIITTEGTVTLRGPVNTLQEKQTIGATAQQIAGANRVNNQLEVISQ